MLAYFTGLLHDAGTLDDAGALKHATTEGLEEMITEVGNLIGDS